MEINNYRCLLMDLDKHREDLRALIEFMSSDKQYTDEEFTQFCTVAASIQTFCEKLPDKSREVLREILKHLNENMEV